MNGNSGVNWTIAFNRLFSAINVENTTAYCSGSEFLNMVRKVNPDCYTYSQLLDERKRLRLSLSRRDYYFDVINSLNEQQRFALYRLFIDGLDSMNKEAADSVRAVVFGGGRAVPITIIPFDVWNSKKLNNSLDSIDQAIAVKHFNRATTLTYTCLEGLYKAYVRKHVPDQAGLTDLMPLCKVVKDDISRKLQAQ